MSCSRAEPCGGLLVLDREHAWLLAQRGLDGPQMYRCIGGGHTFLDPVPPERHVRYVPTCGYCGAPVLERKKDGKRGMLHHPACREAAHGARPTRLHGLVEVEA